MILNSKNSDIFEEKCTDIVFAINKEGINDSGFAGLVCKKGWSELANFGENEIGSVFSKEIDGKTYHAIVCHALNGIIVGEKIKQLLLKNVLIKLMQKVEFYTQLL